MSTIYLLTLRQLAGKWRLVIMTVLATMPVLIAAVMLRSDDAPSVVDFETSILSAMLAGSIAPLIVLAIAAAAFGHEVEDKTLANLTLAPLPRWKIALPKLLATLTLATPFIAASAFATSWIAYIGDWQASLAVTASALVGVALYAAAFVWLGLVTTQGIAIGLLYIVLWEGFFAGYVSGVRLLSIRFHSLALMHGLDERRFAFGSHPSLTVVVVTAAAVFAGFVWMTVRKLRTMDVP